MRIKKAKEAKHEASLTPATAEWVKTAADASLVQLLRDLKAYTRPWGEPRGDLYHWIDILNLFDKILEDFVTRYKLAEGPQTQPFGRTLLTEGLRVDGKCTRGSSDQDLREEEDDETLIIEILAFSLFLLDNCANRSLYSSSDHLSHLLNSTSLNLVTSTLHLGSRLALTYLRLWAHRQANRSGLSLAGLNSTYRIDTDKVQKLAEPFAANLQLTDGGSGSTQTPGKSKETGTPYKKGNKPVPKVHPSDLAAITNSRKPQSDFSEFAWVCFDLQSNSQNTEGPTDQSSTSQAPATPTPARRVSGPSKLSRSTAPDDTLAQDSPHSHEPAHHKLVLQPQIVQDTDIHDLLTTHLPKIPPELHHAFLVRLRYAKAFSGTAQSRQLAAAAKILAFTNIALLYTETMLQQRFMQQDSTEPKHLQIVHQLAELAKPPADGAITEYAIEALDALARGHKAKHNEIITALGINVNHGTLFQILRSVVDDLSGDSAISPRNFRVHDTVFVMLDHLLKQDPSRTSTRTVESLVSTGLFGVLVEILNIHSNKAQATQNRVVQFVSDGMHSVRDGVRAFANAGGLDAVSELVAWEVDTCLQAVREGNGLPLRLKSRLMDYEAPYWNQQTLRTTLKLINHMLQHSNPTTDRLLRNLIDTPVLLKAVNEILKNAKVFGSNNYSQAIMLVSTFINNEPTSFSVIAEAGLSKSLLESVGGSAAEPAVSAPSRKLPIKRVPGNDRVVCGADSEIETVSIAREPDAPLARNVLSSSDVLANLPQTFGAICLNATGMESFLNSNALEAYFEVFESRSHLLAFMADVSLAENVGQAFDELVRHHPRLKTAVIYYVILTIARVDYRCRHLIPASAGAKLVEDVDSTTDDSTEHSQPEVDTVMSGSTDDLSDASNAALGPGVKEPKALDYVGALCRFLVTFFSNHNMVSTFVEQGGLQFLLDLSSLPTIPHDAIKLHHYNAMHAFSKAIHMCVESKPHIALPLVVKYTSDTLDQIRPLQDAHHSGAFFEQAIRGEPQAVRESTTIVKSLVQLEILAHLLQEIFSMPISSRERNPHMLSTVNLTDMYIDLIRRMGLVNRFCVWELVTLIKQLPEDIRTRTSPWVEGWGEEASRVLGLDNALSFRLRTPQPGETTEDLGQTHTGAGSSSEVTSGAGPDSHTDPPQQYSQSHVQNIRVLRHMMTSIPATLTNFFHNIAEKLISRRRPESYQRQNIFMIAETLADAAVAQLKYKPAAAADQALRNDFWTISIENLKNMLNLELYDSSTLHSCVTIVLPGFRNRGGVAALLDILKGSLSVAINSRVQDSPTHSRESTQTSLSTTNAIIKSVLTVLECLTSSKFISESHQSQVLSSADASRPFHFNPSQFLVELRYQILPAVEHAWNEKGSEQLEPGSRKKIIRILRTILEADHEHGAARKSGDVPTPSVAAHSAFKISEEKLRTIQGQGYDTELIKEALYRCANDRDKAPDYCLLRKTLPLPRFPIPAYDQRPEQNLNPPASSRPADRQDSESTIPDPDLDDESQVDVEARADQNATQPTSGVGATTENDADDGRMAMSIDNLLNLSDQGNAEPSASGSGARATGAGISRSADTTSTPIQFVLSDEKVGIDDLEARRTPLRKELIMRVMDMLAVQDDRLTFDLAELLSTAANKAPSAQAMRETRAEFGDTLIQALVSFNDEDKFNEEQDNISAIANLLAILLQEREFYEACVENLKQFIDQLLEFIRAGPSSSHGETYPWIGQILLIFERLLSEELQPASIVWTPPGRDEAVETSNEQIANYADPIFTDEQREKLFDSLSPILPHVGKNKSLALSIVRVLVMLTRHRSIADKLAAKVNLQRLFLMIKQLAGLTTEKLQGAFMLILRHISEDDETIRKTVRNTIWAGFKSSRSSHHHLDTTTFVRQHYALVLRAPKIFLEVTNEILKLQNFDADVRPQTLALKPDILPEMFTPWQPPNATASEKQGEDDKKPGDSGVDAVLPTTEPVEPTESPEKSKAVIKPPVVEHPGGLIHFLLSQLLLYKDTEDQEISTARSQKKDNDAISDVEMEANENTSDDEPTAPHANVPSKSSTDSKSEDAKKEAYRAEDHPIYHYRCFILQCLTELLMSYNQAKVEFINFSRKADPKAMTPSRPKSGVLNYLLSGLIPIDNLERSVTVAALKKQGTSAWAASVVVALCVRTPETLSEPGGYGACEKEARDNDLLFVRKFVVEHAIKAFRDIQNASDLVPEVKYARLLAVSDLFNRVLMGRTLPLHTNSPRQPGETPKPPESEVARIMFEKNLISVLTSSLSEIDLNVPFAKRAVKYILRPLKLLTETAVAFSQNSDISTSPGQTTDDDDISTATSLSDISDDREETPDLFRHSALGMLEPGREEDDSSSESGDEDAEMYDEEDYDDGMDYDEEMDQADDDEAVSDPDDEDMGSDGGMENISGDMPLNMEVVIEGDDDMSPGEDEDDEDEDEDDEDEDEDDDMDEDREMELLDDIEDADGSDDDNEDDWEDELDESGDPIDGHHGAGADDMAEVEAIAEEFAEQLGRAGAFAGAEGPGMAVGGGFPTLEDDVENGTYMNDLRLIRDDEEDEDDYPEDDEGEEIDDDEGEGDFMYEMHGEDEEEPFDMMDEAFGFLGATRQAPPMGHARFGRPDVLVTPDGRPNMFRTIRTHNRGGNDRHGADDGVNPLLQRNNNELESQRRPARPRHLEMLTGNGGLDFLRLMRHGQDAGPAAMVQLHDMFNAAVTSGGGPMGGQMWTSVRPEELEVLLGTQRARPEYTPRESRHQQDDVSQPPPFTPSSTIARWQEAARLLFASGYVEKINKIINSILKLLVPQAIKELRQQQEEEARAAEQRRKEEEKRRKEEEERLAKEEEERQAREREEQQRREEEAEAARQAAEAAGTTEEQPGEAMEGVETEEADDNADAEAAATESGPSQAQPRVMINIRGRQVDITELGIDQEYLDALPEDLREEVLMQAVTERRTQQPQSATATEAPSNVDPAFLDALPEEMRQEILDHEEQQQRRRERQEQRRRDQQATGAPMGAEDMDTASVLASLDPTLRRQVLLEQALSNEILETLPESMQQEARELLQQTQARHGEMGRRFGIPNGLGERAIPGYNPDDPRRRPQRRQVVQMLDRSGIAAILRLLFVPQQGSLKESLSAILGNLAQNRQSRGELISLLLTILQDGSSDGAAVERSYAALTMRSKQPPGQQQTPRPLKRSITGSLTAPLGQEMTPIMVIQQCLSALVGLVQHNGHAQTFFLNPHETPSTLKNKGKQKGKGKDTLAQKYALNALLSLLDRKMIMDNSACMEQLSTLLIRVTQPLNLLRRQERTSEQQDQPEQQAAAPEAETQPIEESAEQGEEQQSAQAAGGSNDAGQSVDKQENKKKKNDDDDSKKPKTPSPPVVPEQNLQLVINILTAKECPSKTFRDTLATINNLSAIPGTKDIFGRELVRQAQNLGEIVAKDLSELLAQLSKETGSTVQSVALSKFSPASSDQGKLLRVLMALDYLFSSKSGDQPPQGSTEEGEARNPMLDSLYESPTFSPAWSRLSDCLKAIQDKDNMMNVATILSPLIEALMVVCKDMTLKDRGPLLSKSQQFAISSPEPESSMDSMFFRFTEDHRKILNELVRNNPRLMSGTFSLLVKNPKVLEFDNKRNYFTRRMHTRDDTRRAHPSLSFTVRRGQIFLDSYQKLFFKKPDEVKYGKLNVKFSGEEGVDAGGVTREWFQALTRQFFNPDYALFMPVAADRTTFHPSKLSWVNPEHLHYFKFIGRIIGKALYENRPLDCHFSRAVYKRILGKQVSIKDMETLDLEHYRSLVWTLENDITDVLTETFSVEADEFGKTEIVDLIPNGRNVAVTDENKHEWVQKLVEYKLTGSINDRLEAFLQGFHEIVPSELVSIFNEQELELLISGLPEIDIEDWKANTDYQNYSATSAQIQWFWRAVRSFDKEERAKLLQFVTGTSKVPLNGFKELEGMNGFSKFSVHRDYGDKDRLPSSHTCFNQLDLPEYDDYETLRSRLYTAMTAGGEYFGFA